MNRKLITVSAIVSMSAIPPVASAEPLARLDAGRSEMAPQRVRPGDYEHDGAYVRLAFGFAGISDSLISEEAVENHDEAEGLVTGMGTVGEEAVGGTLGRGVILGGGLWTTTMFSSNYTHVDGDQVPQELRRPQNFTLLGPFADWYFDPKAGWHGQAALGLALHTSFRPESRDLDDDRFGVGAGLMLGFGHEWWVDRNWSIGALARLTAAGLVEEDDDNTWFHGVATFPALLLTATYN